MTRPRVPDNPAIDEMQALATPTGHGVPPAPTPERCVIEHPKKPARRLDPVIQALARCEQILNELDPPEADRVLDWLQGKYGTPKQRPAQEFRD